MTHTDEPCSDLTLIPPEQVIYNLSEGAWIRRDIALLPVNMALSVVAVYSVCLKSIGVTTCVCLLMLLTYAVLCGLIEERNLSDDSMSHSSLSVYAHSVSQLCLLWFGILVCLPIRGCKLAIQKWAGTAVRRNAGGRSHAYIKRSVDYGSGFICCCWFTHIEGRVGTSGDVQRIPRSPTIVPYRCWLDDHGRSRTPERTTTERCESSLRQVNGIIIDINGECCHHYHQ